MSTIAGVVTSEIFIWIKNRVRNFFWLTIGFWIRFAIEKFQELQGESGKNNLARWLANQSVSSLVPKHFLFIISEPSISNLLKLEPILKMFSEQFFPFGKNPGKSHEINSEGRDE